MSLGNFYSVNRCCAIFRKCRFSDVSVPSWNIFFSLSLSQCLPLPFASASQSHPFSPFTKLKLHFPLFRCCFMDSLDSLFLCTNSSDFMLPPILSTYIQVSHSHIAPLCVLCFCWFHFHFVVILRRIPLLLISFSSFCVLLTLQTSNS